MSVVTTAVGCTWMRITKMIFGCVIDYYAGACAAVGGGLLAAADAGTQ